MANRIIINHIADTIRTAAMVNGSAKLATDRLAEIAADAYEHAAEHMVPADQPCRFTVRGRGIFPADMLRHDHCWPVDGAINAISDHTYNNRQHGVSITLCAQSARRITPARWASFGWTVIDIAGQEVVS